MKISKTNFSYKGINIEFQLSGLENDNKTLTVFLHGWGGSLKSFEFFFKQYSYFAPCLNLSFPPFGNSDKLNEPWDVRDYAEMVVSLLIYVKNKFFNWEKVNIVAHSFGGRVAILLASKENFVSKLLLTGCAGIKNKSFKRKIKVIKYKIFKFLASLKLYQKESLALWGSEDYKNLSPIMKQTFNKIVNFDEKKYLKYISCPTLLFWGKEDKETPFYFTKSFKKNIKDCEIVQTNGGHFAYLEESGLFLKVLIAFFKN